MAAQMHEFSAKTVDEAVADGLRTLNLQQDQVEIEVVNKGSRGIFGIGSEPAQIRIRVKLPVPEQMQAAPVLEPVIESTVTPSLPPADVNYTDMTAEAERDQATTGMVKPMGSVPTEAATVATVADAPLPKMPDTDMPDDEALFPLAVDLLTQLVHLMGFQANVVATWKAADEQSGEYEERYLLLDIQGADLGALIGRRGETLDNIQYLLRLMVNQQMRQWKNIVVDVEQYKARRVTQLTQLALRTAEQVAASGQAVALEPMPPNERRVVHLALRDHATVYTESAGEGERRKVNIVAKD